MVWGFFWQLQSLPRNNNVRLYFFFYQLLVMIVFKKIRWLHLYMLVLNLPDLHVYICSGSNVNMYQFF